MTYKIVRFRNDGGVQRVIKKGLTLKEAKEYCADPSTKGNNWFDGFVRED